MQTELFENLIGDAINEITDRHPAYFSHCTIDVPPLEQILSDCERLPLFSSCSREDLVNALTCGLTHLKESAVPVRMDSERTDPISRLLICSILDAYAAARGDLSVRPARRKPPSIEAVLGGGHLLKKRASGVDYLISNGAGPTLLIISAVGMPLSVWLRLLEHDELERRYLIVQGGTGPLIEGGTAEKSSIWRDVAGIQEVLAAEQLTNVDVLAWCTGTRVAIELARRMPEQIASIMLLGPTVYGAVDSRKYPSPFEDDLFQLRGMLARESKHAASFLRAFAQAMPLADLRAFKDDTEKRANAVLSLPPRSVAVELVSFLSSATCFMNFADHVFEPYDTGAAVAAISCPIFALVGTHDTAANAHAVRDVLSQWGKDVVFATLSGGGHHIHLLQFNYFMYVLECFLARAVPRETARLSVDRRKPVVESLRTAHARS